MRLIDNLQNVSIDYKPVFGKGIFYVKNLIAFTLCPVNTLNFANIIYKLKVNKREVKEGKRTLGYQLLKNIFLDRKLS